MLKATLVAALMAASITAQAQVDHMAFNYPACVTPFHLDEAEALMRAHRPINENVCMILPKGTEVVMVGDDIYTPQRIVYNIDDGTVAGKTLSLFTNKGALGDWVAKRAADATQDKQDEQAADAFMKTVGGDFHQRDELRRTWIVHRRCLRESGPDDEVCKLGGNDLQKQLAKVKDTDGLRAEIDMLKTKYDRCTTYQKFGSLDPICKGIAGAIEDKERETFNRKHSN